MPAADAYLVVAAAREALGEPAAAVAALEAARKVLVAARIHTKTTPVMRLEARVNALLAIAKRDRALAEAARAWYRAAGGYDDAIRALSW